MKVLAIIVLTYLFFKYSIRLLAPFILQFFAKKMHQKFNDQFNDQFKNQSKEGEVTIEGKNKKTNSKNHDVGDYVEYEEVEE